MACGFWTWVRSSRSKKTGPLCLVGGTKGKKGWYENHYVIVDCHFIVMSPLCIRSLPDFFVDCLLLFFSLGCVYLCSHLPWTSDEWVPIHDFYLQGFSSFCSTQECDKVLRASCHSVHWWWFLPWPVPKRNQFFHSWFTFQSHSNHKFILKWTPTSPKMDPTKDHLSHLGKRLKKHWNRTPKQVTCL